MAHSTSRLPRGDDHLVEAEGVEPASVAAPDEVSATVAARVGDAARAASTAAAARSLARQRKLRSFMHAPDAGSLIQLYYR